MISLSIISPVLGSDTLGPTALRVVDATYRTVEYRISSGLKSGSSYSVGGYLARIAFLKPAFSKAVFQSSIPCLKYGRHWSGVAGSK